MLLNCGSQQRIWQQTDHGGADPWTCGALQVINRDNREVNVAGYELHSGNNEINECFLPQQ